MKKGSTVGGLDAHKVSINVALFVPGKGQPVEWTCANEKASVLRMVKKALQLAVGRRFGYCFEELPPLALRPQVALTQE